MRKGNLRLVVCVVEAWSDLGEPTQVARLAQVRALADLCAVDRAWARLAPMLEGTKDLETFQVAARLLVDQGRIDDARLLIGRARKQFPADPILKQQWARTDGSGTQIDLTEPNEHDVEARIRHTERLLREGSPLKARRLLERIQHDFPEHQRVNDLLWAGEGEFVLRGVTLADLAQVHAPSLALLGADEPERTETGRPDIVAAMLDEDSNHGFASLFKGMGLAPAQVEEREVTMSSSARDLDDVFGDTVVEHTETGREDTQIMHVVRKDGDPSAVDTLIDRAPPPEPAPSGESEDEHVILRRRHQNTPTGAGQRRTDEDAPVRLDPSRERVAHGASASDEAADFIKIKPKPVVSLDDTPVSVARELPPTPVEPPRRSKAFHSAPTMVLEEPAFPTEPPTSSGLPNVTWTGWLVVLVVLMALVVGFGGLVILLQIVAVL